MDNENLFLDFKKEENIEPQFKSIFYNDEFVECENLNFQTKNKNFKQKEDYFQFTSENQILIKNYNKDALKEIKKAENFIKGNKYEKKKEEKPKDIKINRMNIKTEKNWNSRVIAKEQGLFDKNLKKIEIFKKKKDKNQINDLKEENIKKIEEMKKLLNEEKKKTRIQKIKYESQYKKLIKNKKKSKSKVLKKEKLNFKNIKKDEIKNYNQDLEILKDFYSSEIKNMTKYNKKKFNLKDYKVVENPVKKNNQKNNDYINDKPIKELNNDIELENKIIENRNKTKSVINQCNKKAKPLIDCITKNTDFKQNFSIYKRSIGRLIKLHSEEIIEKIWNELMLEIVCILNDKEAAESDKKQKLKINFFINEMLEEIKCLEENQTSLSKYKSLVNQTNDVISKDLNIKYIDLQKKENIYKDNKVKLNYNYEDIINLSRNYVIRENFVNEMNYLNKDYVKGVSNIIDEIINECYNDVYEEFNDVNKHFVNEVIDSEFK